MKNISHSCSIFLLAAACMLFAASSAMAGTILHYDSNGGTQLARIASETDAAFVAGSDATTSVGSAVAAIGAHGSQSVTVTLGTGNDMMYRFGTGAYSDDLPTALADGKWVGANFVAAQDLNLEELTFALYNNSNSASSYAARDVALYVRIGADGGFTQFGDIDDTATGNGNQGTITFTDLFTVLSGQTVQLRLAFTDRTRTNVDAQAATRVGSINISATAGGDATKVSTSSSAPATNILSSDGTGATDTGLFDETVNANHARGQLFSLPDGSGTEFEITAVTIKKSNTQTYISDAITLRIFEGTSAQWDTGTGHSTGTDGDDHYVDTSVTPLHTEVFTLNGSFTNNDFVTFTLSKPITVNEDTDIGFFMTYHQAAGTAGDFRHRENANGGRLSITTSDHGITSGGSARGLHYFVQGTAAGIIENLVLASPYQDRMVLQRNKAVKVWGEALPSTAVSVSFDGANVNTTSDVNGNWEVELPSHSAGGPYILTVTSGAETKIVNDVLVGDVWFCFGQSNMVYTLNQMGSWKTTYINDIIANDEIRCLKITQQAATSEQNEGPMTWLDNSTAGSWSAVAATFAHQMHQETGVPTAIVWAAWGSSSIEGWMPLSMTEQFPHFDAIMDDYYLNDEADVTAQLNGSQTYDDIYIRTRPNIIYNQMVHPMLNYGISGFIWYQGESNAGNILNCAQYEYTLPGMVTEYRKRFDQGELTFLGVQLPSINAATRSVWHWFRESQGALEDMTNGHVAVTVDTGSTNGEVHPVDEGKAQIGERLSLLARKYSLGENIVADGPRFSSMSIAGNTATLSFDNDSGLITTDDPATPAGFEVAGTDMVFHAATSTAIVGTQVTVSSSSVANPVAVRYAWDMLTKGVVNLVNGAALPAAPFRTDSWALPGLGAQSPVSNNDAHEIVMNMTLNIPVDGVLGNDFDLNDDSLSATLVTDVSDGTLTLLSDGSFDYTPHSGFAGTDSFTYYSSDGSLNSPNAIVTITVNGVQSGYYTWRTGISWNPSDDATETGDADLDGTVNFLEFALGLDPLVASTSGLPTLAPNGSDYDYDFNNLQPGVNYKILLSTDLVNWSSPAFSTLTSADSTPVLIPSSESVDGKLFIRLEVEEIE